MLREARMLLLLLLHSATAIEVFTTDAGLKIWVVYPDGASEGVPLVVHLHGTTMNPSPDESGVPHFQSALDAGFAFAILEYPNWDGSDMAGYPTSTVGDDFDGTQFCETIAGKAAELFGPAETTSLSMLCALEKIDCSKGVGVVGYSQGSEIGSMAAMLDDRVKAYFGIGLNTVNTYTTDTTAQMEENTCLRDATLDPSARRYLAGGEDDAWQGGADNAYPWPGAEPEDYESNMALIRYQVKATSGYVDCGKKLDCLYSDGSGYVVLPGVNHYDIYAFSHDPEKPTEEMVAYGPMMNGFEWLMGRTLTDAPGCPCPEGSRRKLLFGSMPESICCAKF